MNATETFQHYQVLRRDDGALWELGRGAMGVTYKAFDVNLRCFVALKVINGNYLDHPVARQRFIREARAAAALRHRNIAHVYHLGMDAQSFFYAMEFIDGETLDALVRRKGPLPPESVLKIGLQTARALAAAARQRLVHRDIKPANLMILAEDEDGEVHQTVKVIDFGLARSAVRGDASTHLTMSGFVGTPQYASPEQLEEKNVDGRSDIYSLGVTLWYLLAGRPPFVGTLTSLITQHLTKEPPWEQIAVAAPAPVRELLTRMLQKNPDLRPQSAGELKLEVENCLRSLVAHGEVASNNAGSGLNHLGSKEDYLPIASLRVEDNITPNKPDIQTPSVGSLVGGRYQIMRLVGEGSTGRVFQAHDLRGEGQTVALKVLHPELFLNSQDCENLRADAAKVRAAPHPGLLRLLDLEAGGGLTYLVTEWSGGLTLVDLLRSRGRLTVAEALALLKQAAVVTDFAREKSLNRLELHLHQIFVVPTGVAVNRSPSSSASEGEGAAFLAKNPLATDLRIDPLGAARDESDLVTWAGDLTLLSSRQPPISGHSGKVDGHSEPGYLQSLARIFYELVEGVPLSDNQWPAQARGPAFMVPGLGERGNAVLRRGFSPEHGFASDSEFFEALARAAGHEPESLQFRPSAMEPLAVLPGVFNQGASTADAPLSRMRETSGLPAGGNVAVLSTPPTRRLLKPIVRRQGGSRYPLMINLRTVGWMVVGGLAICLFVGVIAMTRFWPARHAPSPASSTPSDPTTSPTFLASPKPIATAAESLGNVLPPAGTGSEAGSSYSDSTGEFSVSDWLEGSALTEAIAMPVTVIPYAPGVAPDEDTDTEEVRIPFAPEMAGEEADDASGKAAPDADTAESTPGNGSASRTAKNGGLAKASTDDARHGHIHHRSAPPPRNFWQRLLGIKPKPTHGK